MYQLKTMPNGASRSRKKGDFQDDTAKLEFAISSLESKYKYRKNQTHRSLKIMARKLCSQQASISYHSTTKHRNMMLKTNLNKQKILTASEIPFGKVEATGADIVK